MLILKKWIATNNDWYPTTLDRVRVSLHGPDPRTKWVKNTPISDNELFSTVVVSGGDDYALAKIFVVYRDALKFYHSIQDWCPKARLRRKGMVDY